MSSYESARLADSVSDCGQRFGITTKAVNVLGSRSAPIGTPVCLEFASFYQWHMWNSTGVKVRCTFTVNTARRARRRFVVDIVFTLLFLWFISYGASLNQGRFNDNRPITAAENQCSMSASEVSWEPWKRSAIVKQSLTQPRAAGSPLTAPLRAAAMLSSCIGRSIALLNDVAAPSLKTQFA